MVLNKGWALLLEKKENLSLDCTFLASVALVTSFAGATAIFGIAFQGVLLHTLTFGRAASPVDPLGTVWKQIEANSSPENHTLLFFFFPHIVTAQSCSSVGPDYGENKGIILTAKKQKTKIRKTNVFQIRQFICFLATWHEQWSLNYLKGFGASGREIASQRATLVPVVSNRLRGLREGLPGPIFILPQHGDDGQALMWKLTIVFLPFHCIVIGNHFTSRS